MNNYATLFNLLVQYYRDDKIDVVLTMNGVDYDRDFDYNEQLDIFTAKSTSFPEQEFGSDGKTLACHIYNKNIEIKIKFNK